MTHWTLFLSKQFNQPCTTRQRNETRATRIIKRTENEKHFRAAIELYITEFYVNESPAYTTLKTATWNVSSNFHLHRTPDYLIKGNDDDNNNNRSAKSFWMENSLARVGELFMFIKLASMMFRDDIFLFCFILFFFFISPSTTQRQCTCRQHKSTRQVLSRTFLGNFPFLPCTTMAKLALTLIEFCDFNFPSTFMKKAEKKKGEALNKQNSYVRCCCARVFVVICMKLFPSSFFEIMHSATLREIRSADGFQRVRVIYMHDGKKVHWNVKAVGFEGNRDWKL